MGKKLSTFLVVIVSAIFGGLVTFGTIAYFACDPNVKYRYMDFNDSAGAITFKNFTVSQELNSHTGTPFLYLKRKGVCFGIIGTSSEGRELIKLSDPNNRMVFLLSFRDDYINKITLMFDDEGKSGARYNATTSDWEYVWRFESEPNDFLDFLVDINRDNHDDVKKIISPNGEETGQFIFYENKWILVNEYRESEDGETRAEDSKDKYIFDKKSGLWHIEETENRRAVEKVD
jgi:hypothetical protein